MVSEEDKAGEESGADVAVLRGSLEKEERVEMEMEWELLKR